MKRANSGPLSGTIRFFQKLDLSNLLRKTDYYVLASLLLPDQSIREVATKLDGILQVAARAKPKEP